MVWQPPSLRDGAMDTDVARRTADELTLGKSGLMLIADNGEAFAARVLAARSATSTLDLMYYLWHDDHTGRLLAREVVQAAERGVRVRLLVDDINPRASDAAYLALNSHPNIELRLFNPSGMRNSRILRGLEMVARLFAMTRRMHNKAWIADGKVAIVGGRNIGDAYFDRADTNFRDLDVLLLGPAVEQTAAIFERYWRCEMAKPVHVLNPSAKPRRADIANHVGSGRDLGSAIGGKRSIDEFIAASNDMHWMHDARVIADPPEKAAGRRRRNWLMRELMPVIESARERLEIVSPYFIPGRKGLAVLTKLVRRGVDVTVLTNSLAATDVAAVHGAYSNYRIRLLKRGVKLFELQPFSGPRDISVFGSKGASLHTKAFAVDGRIGFVGSFNFDPRSVSLNAEMGVMFEDRVLVEELRRCFGEERLPQSSYRVSLREGRLHWEGIDDGEMKRLSREPEAPLTRRLIATLVRYLPIESQL